MRHFLRALLLLLLGAASFNAAAVISTITQFSHNLSSPIVWQDSAVAACDLGYAYRQSQWSTAPYSVAKGNPYMQGGPPINQCNVDRFNNGAPSGTLNFALTARNGYCPTNSTAVTGGCQCSAGFDESGGLCVPHVNQCTAKTGTFGTANLTMGWTRTPNDNDTAWIGGTPASKGGSTQCSSGCAVEIADIQNYFVSQVPNAQGLYRNSADYVSKYTGAECSAQTTGAGNPAATEPACPGAVGEVNGVKGCYGTAAAPVVTTNGPKPTTAQPIAGNPAAGPKPESGEGSGAGSSGRTPSAGSAGNAGGPAAAAVGGRGGAAGGTSTGTGSVAAPGAGEEQAACGAPGQPKCAIDETGVGEGGGTSFDSANTALTTNSTTAGTAITAAHGTAAPSWSFSFQLPTGCTPVQVNIKNFTLNPCGVQSTIHDLMSMIWAAVTAFTIIGMVGKTIREA